MSKALWFRIAVAFAILAGIVAVWRWSPLAEIARPEVLADWGLRLRGQWWGYAAAIGIFLAAGFVVFPASVLIAAAALVFGPMTGIAVSYAGSLVSAIGGYLVGELLGRRGLQVFLSGGRLQAVSEALAKRGILSVALIRQVPLAPFSVVNFVAGMSHIRFVDYVVGTAIGIVPGVVAITLMTGQLLRVVQAPNFANAAVFVVVVVIVLGFSALAVRFATR
ncbi:MAG: VTT domain-containing protein, partial [Proteobacteria bacterium]|nr:VTT domain-containing protein [Pseudomonadota bacterium]